VAEQVVRTSSVPVLTVHPEVPVSSLEIRSILVPHDFSDQSAAAVRLAGRWAETLGAALTLIHVVEPVVYPDLYAVDLLPAEMMERLERRSTEALEESSAELLPGVDARVRVIVGRAADTIVGTAESDQHDLIIMGTRGLSALEHLLMGSVAEQVVRTSSTPVLTVRH
jgi:nucleotide-binding universal stress UspA family protein